MASSDLKLRSGSATAQFFFPRGLPSSYSIEHLGKPGRFATAGGATGLYHTAIVYPTRAALATALRRVLSAQIPLEGAADHGVSESIYLRDPDDNGVELYWDKPKQLWPHDSQGGLAMFTHRLDLRDLLSEAPPDLTLSTGPEDL